MAATGCQDLPAMGGVSIYELAANSGSSWLSQAPNLHFARQLLLLLLLLFSKGESKTHFSQINKETNK